MNKLSTAFVVGFAVIAASSASHAQTTTTTTTTWTNDEGPMLTKSYTTNKYTVVTDPTLQPNVGVILPPTVTFYPVPPTIMIPDRELYEYSVINNHPVVVEKTTRKVVHTWN